MSIRVDAGGVKVCCDTAIGRARVAIVGFGSRGMTEEGGNMNGVMVSELAARIKKSCMSDRDRGR